MSAHSAEEKLIQFDLGTFIRPSAVTAITPRIGGSDVYLNHSMKVFVPLSSTDVAARLGMGVPPAPIDARGDQA